MGRLTGEGGVGAPCQNMLYSKPPTISPGLIYFRKRFLMGLYKGGLIYGGGGGGLIHGQSFVLVINKSNIKQVSYKQENFRGLIFGGLIYGGRAYIWNEVSVSTCGELIYGGGLYLGGGGL